MEATLRTDTQYKTVVERLMVVPVNASGSSSGRTSCFEREDRGSNPRPETSFTDRAGSAPLPRVPDKSALQAWPHAEGLSGQISDERTNRDSATTSASEINRIHGEVR